MATCMNERFPTEVRGAARGFCCYQGAIWGGFVARVIACFATVWPLGYAIPMKVGTMVFALIYAVALLTGPETKGTELVADLVVA